MDLFAVGIAHLASPFSTMRDGDVAVPSDFGRTCLHYLRIKRTITVTMQLDCNCLLVSFTALGYLNVLLSMANL